MTSRLAPAAVELGVEDRLPRAEVEPPVGDRQHDLVVDEQVLPVRVAVVLAAAVVAEVAGVGRELARDVVRRLLPRRRRELVEPLERVLEEPGLVVVDPDARGDVHRRDEHHALGDAGLVDGLLDVVGDAHELAALGGLEGQVAGVGAHVTSIAARRRRSGARCAAMDLELRDKVCVVTGASSGIGLEASRSARRRGRAGADGRPRRRAPRGGGGRDRRRLGRRRRHRRPRRTSASSRPAPSRWAASTCSSTTRARASPSRSTTSPTTTGTASGSSTSSRRCGSCAPPRRGWRSAAAGGSSTSARARASGRR